MNNIAEEQRTYFDLLAELGHTKHIGGLAATKRLVALVEPQASDTLLDVGCGVGIGPVYLAERCGCHVVGVDITPRMLERARERAERHGVTGLTAFRAADMHALPFADHQFDAAIAESVLTFSPVKTAVINELARVVRPGGMVAFTEAIWIKLPPEDKRDFMARAGGMPEGVLSHGEWQEILAASRLQGIVAEAYRVTAREESKNQYGRIQPADYLRTVPNFFRAIRQARFRRVFRTAAGSLPGDYFNHIGYGIYGGEAA